jgi:dTDP-4-amino-4,6-dideoxygalactose transaminase
MHSFYKPRFAEGSFPVADKVFSELLSIPLFPSMNEEDIEYVITNLNDLAWRHNG